MQFACRMKMYRNDFTLVLIWYIFIWSDFLAFIVILIKETSSLISFKFQLVSIGMCYVIFPSLKNECMADITQYNQFIFPMNKYLLPRPILHKVCKVLGSWEASHQKAYHLVKITDIPITWFVALGLSLILNRFSTS